MLKDTEMSQKTQTGRERERENVDRTFNTKYAVKSVKQGFILQRT